MNRTHPSRRPISNANLWLLSILVGVVAGFGAVAFRGLIGFFHNLLFLGKLSVFYNANVHTGPSPWGAWVILVPVVGGLVVAFLVKNFALEAKGHGVPEVMEAIYYHKGVIRPVVALIKSLASAVSIGSGGSVGREGPIVQIGSSFGSTVGQVMKLPGWQRITLLAAGAGGGIAATFNTPIGGVLFAAELLLHEVSVWTLVPVVISTATATYIGRLFLGANPSFIIREFQTLYFHPTDPLVLLAYVGLGCVAGVLSVLFIRTIYGFEDFFEQKVPGNYYTRHLAGMLMVGVLIYLTQVTWGHYYIEGVGYAAVQDVLTGTLGSLTLLLALFGLKLLATALTLGSGGSGGIFSPLLFLGATFGAAYGLVLKAMFPGLPVSPPAFAVAGMAGMVGGATGAAITAIVIIFEMTLDYNVILPMTITVAMSYGVRNFLSRQSIYSLKLARRGHAMPEALQANFHFLRLARDVMTTSRMTIPASTPLEELRSLLSRPDAPDFLLVESDGKLAGAVGKKPVACLLSWDGKGTRIGDLATPTFEVVTERATLFELLSRLRARPVELFVVVAPGDGGLSAGDVKGIITKERIADSMTESLGLFAE